MTGIDAKTGKMIDPWPHTCQSVKKIFGTMFGERVMREEFGGIVLPFIFQNIDNRTLKLLYWAMVVSIHLWEPRFRVTRVIPDETPDTRREGEHPVDLRGDFMPRGHLGDFTVSKRNVSISL